MRISDWSSDVCSSDLGGHMIEENLACLDSLYARGARYLTLTWNNSISWASSAQDEVLHPARLPNGKGLNEFGRSVIRRMNELGMMVDLSHTGDSTLDRKSTRLNSSH